MRFRQLGAGRKQRCAPLGQRIAFGAAGAQLRRSRRIRALGLARGVRRRRRLRLGLELIDAVQPERDLERSFFLVENQIALGVFGLLAQRLDADGDLGENVVDTEEVLLGIAQLAFGLQLFIADLADAGGLLEDAAALVPLLGKHLADLPLADNRIALAADAGIVKQLVNVL